MSFINNQATATLAASTATYKYAWPTMSGSAIGGTGVVVQGGTAGSPTIGSGIAGALDTTINAVPSGGTIGAIVLWTPATIGGVGSPMVAWIDTAASGLPIVPNGGNVTVSWSRGTNLIFKL
jgi:hypothetical protein